jgi:hypothetical protein
VGTITAMVMKRKNPNLPNDGNYFFSVSVKEILPYALCISKADAMNSSNPSNSTNSSNPINSSNGSTAALHNLKE